MPSPAQVAIVTDSTSDIPEAMAVGNGITVIPLCVDIAGRTYRDGELTQARFFEEMGASASLPTTSQPSVGTFTAAYESALEHARSVVSLHISEHLSGTIAAARQAAEAFEGRVQVFDSRNLSWGLGWQVLEAARAAGAGMSAEEVLRVCESTRERVRMLVGVDKLDNLAKGGRIGAVSAFLGGLLNLKITFTVGRDGRFEPVARTRGTAAALQHTVDWVKEQMDGRTRAAVCVMHAMSLDKAEWLKQQIEEAVDVAEMHIVETGVVIATHTGTGWGVAFLPLD